LSIRGVADWLDKEPLNRSSTMADKLRTMHNWKSENKRYRDALEFYADEENWGADYGFHEISKDNGKRARQALKGEQEQEGKE